jgi:polyferredoxin
MHGQYAIGIAATLLNIAVHAAIMTTVNRAVHRTSLATQAARAHLRLMLVMMATVSVLMFAHLIEIGIWGMLYAVLEVVPPEADAYYFAFVNYTTLGYGDIVPVPYWRVLGPMAAMNGVLLFGWSSAVIYDVLRTIALVDPANRGELGPE